MRGRGLDVDRGRRLGRGGLLEGQDRGGGEGRHGGGRVHLEAREGFETGVA